MTTVRKTKRKLTNIDFSSETSHIALVTPEIGGPANGADYALVLKANKFSQEAIQKMQQVQVTLDLPDFLEKFFHLYGTDAQVLARMMGYVPEKEEPEEYNSDWYENYIQEKLDSFQILKSLKDADSLPNVLSTLDENQYLSMLLDQQKIEKALEQVEANKESETVAKAAETDTSTHASVETKIEAPASKVTKSKDKEKQMIKPDTEVKTTVEMVEKSALESLQKSLDAQAVELQKALDTVKAFEVEKKEMVIKSKTAQFQAVIKDEKVLAPIVKAALALENQEDFDSLLTAVSSLVQVADTSKENLEKSALFTEQGATVSEETPVKESAVARVLKAKHTQK
jgi:hypothetical protein